MEKHQHGVSHILELGVSLAVRVDEILDLRLGELTLPREACAWSDLVAEGAAYLRNTEGEAVGVLFNAELVIQKDALRGLGPQVPLQVAARADRRGKHQVEGVRLAEIVARIRRFDAILEEHRVQVLLGVRVRLIPHRRVLLPLFLGDARLLQLFLHDLLQQLVRAVKLRLILDVLHHEVVESVNVPRRFQNLVLHDAGVLDLEQVLLDDEMLPPLPDQVVLHRTSRWAVSEEAGNASVDIEGLPVKETPLGKVGKLPLVLLVVAPARR
mmetsp:Transcript_94949/g.268170  ORF Transcript_94949/g.268170 Transcript_94949/m.268170 type:complete len:269 (+) Transcript_94949:1216-2022(+)